MCGIVGYITSEKIRGTQDRRRFLDQALIAGTVRGDDRTGVFSVRHDQKEDEAAGSSVRRTGTTSSPLRSSKNPTG